MMYEVGDKIVITRAVCYNGKIKRGFTGKIIGIPEDASPPILVYFDKVIEGHSKDDNCYYVWEEDIRRTGKIENWKERLK